MDRVVDRRVAPAVPAQVLDVALAERGGLMHDPHGKVAERSKGRLEVGLPVVVGRMLGEFCSGALGTEVVGMRANSIVTVVGARDDDGEELALDAGQLRGAEHDRLVETHRCAKNA